MSVYAEGGETGSVPAGKSAELNLPFNALSGKELEAEAAVKAFGKREFTIPFTKIPSELLFASAEWSPIELQWLLPIVAELNVVEGGEGNQQELPFPQK